MQMSRDKAKSSQSQMMPHLCKGWIDLSLLLRQCLLVSSHPVVQSLSSLWHICEQAGHCACAEAVRDQLPSGFNNGLLIERLTEARQVI